MKTDLDLTNKRQNNNQRVRKPARKQRDCLEYLYANPHATNGEVMRVIGCSNRTVTLARQMGVRQGLLPRSYYDSTSPTETVPSIPTDGAEELERQLASMRGETGEPLTTEQKLSMLSSHARRAHLEGDTKRATDAIIAHTRIEQQTTAVHLGPSAPLTAAEKIDRMTVLIDVVGPMILANATYRALSAEDRTAFLEEWGRLTATQHTQPEGASVEATPSSSNAVTHGP